MVGQEAHMLWNAAVSVTVWTAEALAQLSAKVKARVEAQVYVLAVGLRQGM